MKKLNIYIIAVITILLVSCDSKTYDQIKEQVVAEGPVTNPTYQKNIKKIMTINCLGCHATGARFPPLDNFEDVKTNVDIGDVLCRIDNPGTCFGEIMPPITSGGRMPQATIDLIKLWKQQGFIN
jgi:hypothetical protein